MSKLDELKRENAFLKDVRAQESEERKLIEENDRLANPGKYARKEKFSRFKRSAGTFVGNIGKGASQAIKNYQEKSKKNVTHVVKKQRRAYSSARRQMNPPRGRVKVIYRKAPVRRRTRIVYERTAPRRRYAPQRRYAPVRRRVARRSPVRRSAPVQQQPRDLREGIIW
jgi:hypothetical protein